MHHQWAHGVTNSQSALTSLFAAQPCADGRPRFSDVIQSDGTRCATAQPRSLAHVSRKFIFSRVPFGSRRQVLSSDSRSCSGLFPDLRDRQRTTRTQPRCAPLRASPPRPLGPLITHTVPAGSTRYTPPFDSYFCSGRSRPRGGGLAALRAGWRPCVARKPPVASASAS